MFENERMIVPYFGERLKEIRETCSLTQDTLADATGIDRSTLAYYESGRVYPSFSRMRRIASILCISLDVLLGTEYGIQQLWDAGPPNIDKFFGNKSATPTDQPVAQYTPRPLPASLGALSPEEQLLVLYYRQLENKDKTQYISELSETVERIQREYYGLEDDDADIVITESNMFDD